MDNNLEYIDRIINNSLNDLRVTPQKGWQELSSKLPKNNISKNIPKQKPVSKLINFVSNNVLIISSAALISIIGVTVATSQDNDSHINNPKKIKNFVQNFDNKRTIQITENSSLEIVDKTKTIFPKQENPAVSGKTDTIKTTVTKVIVVKKIVRDTIRKIDTIKKID